jgi:hypothetical protein
MGILKKSGRAEARIPMDAGTCMIQKSGRASHPILVQMHDLSHGGMSFFTNDALFKENEEIRIQFLYVKEKPILMIGKIAAMTPQKGKRVRYSVQFNETLSNEKLSILFMVLPILKKIS